LLAAIDLIPSAKCWKAWVFDWSEWLGRSSSK